MLNRVKDYTAKNESMWNEKYFNPKPVQISLPQAQKPKLKGFGDYDETEEETLMNYRMNIVTNL